MGWWGVGGEWVFCRTKWQTFFYGATAQQRQLVPVGTPLVSLVGAATSIIFVVTKFVLSGLKYACHNKTFVARNMCLSQQNICHDKNDACGSSGQWYSSSSRQLRELIRTCSHEYKGNLVLMYCRTSSQERSCWRGLILQTWRRLAGVNEAVVPCPPQVLVSGGFERWRGVNKQAVDSRGVKKIWNRWASCRQQRWQEEMRHLSY